MNKKIVYVTFDEVNIFEGDNFYLIKSNHIKYWDSNVIASLAENKQYLDGTLKFSNKLLLKKYILDNDLVLDNYKHIFKIKQYDTNV
jgi:hypothetical protein